MAIEWWLAVKKRGAMAASTLTWTAVFILCGACKPEAEGKLATAQVAAIKIEAAGKGQDGARIRPG